MNAAWWLCMAGSMLGLLAFGRPPRLAPTPTGTPSAALRTMSIVIPARNEALSLPLLLADLAAHRPPGSEVIVVDDGSTDDTAAIASSFGFVTLVDPGDPPPGWAGKTWACRAGSAVASGELLCFLDADVRLREGALEEMARQVALRGGLVSVQPWHETRRPYEQASALFNVISVMGTAVHANGRARGAFGPAMATSRADYDLVGGHEAVAADVVEDLALARRYNDNDRTVTVLGGGNDVRYRMYPNGFRSLVEGWTKNFALGAASTSIPRLLGVVGWIAAMGTAAGMILDASSGDVSWLAALGAYGIFVVQLRLMFAAVGSFGWITALLFPLLLVVFILVFANSLWSTLVRRRVRWRGRELDLHARRTS